jgi:AraC-like DNA-binding protein
MKLYIKSMVSTRCKMIVKVELMNLGLHFITVDLGEVEIVENLSKEQREYLKIALFKSGLEIMDNKNAVIIEKIKNVIVEWVHNSDDKQLKVKFSKFLSEKLNYDYTYLSNVFSSNESITIEHFILLHKIERVKELLIYNEINLTEIAAKLHYSSVAHLSNQFTKIAGFTPSHFKSLKPEERLALKNVGIM